MKPGSMAANGAACPSAANGPVSIFVPTMGRDRMKRAHRLSGGPIDAPRGRKASRSPPCGSGSATRLSQETPLYAAESVGTGQIHQRALDAVQELLVGWLR